MYENIINFLLGRKRKNLSKEETDDLIKLIAQSIGLEEEYKEKTDDKSFIKRILDEVDIEDNTGEEEFGGALEDVFDFDEDSFDYSEDVEDFSENYDDVQPLSKRKINRKNVFKNNKKIKENKPTNEEMGQVEKPKDDPIKEEDMKQEVNVKENSKHDDKKEFHEEKKEFTDDREKLNISSDGKEEVKTFKFQLPSGDTPKFNLPSSFKTNIEDEEFKFEIGNLSSVKHTGPTFKFFDEEGKEI